MRCIVVMSAKHHDQKIMTNKIWIVNYCMWHNIITGTHNTDSRLYYWVPVLGSMRRAGQTLHHPGMFQAKSCYKPGYLPAPAVHGLLRRPAVGRAGALGAVPDSGSCWSSAWWTCSHPAGRLHMNTTSVSETILFLTHERLDCCPAVRLFLRGECYV